MSAKHDNRIAALVPVLNEADILGAFLRRLRHIGVSEIVVADGGSTDGSLDIARDLADQVVASLPGRGRQIARAADAVSAGIFWIVHCDCVPPQNAIVEIIETLTQKGVLMGAFPIVFDVAHPFLRCYSFFSRFDSPMTTFGDQGFFMRATDYRRVGGAPETSLFEDVELRRRVCRLGKVAKTQSRMKTSARQFLRRGVVYQQALNSILLARYYAGASPETLAKFYYSIDGGARLRRL